MNGPATKVVTVVILLVLSRVTLATPNHLVPIPAYDSRGYSQAVFESLLGNSRPKLWMIVRPSFAKEYALVLHHKVEYERKDGQLTSPVKKVREEWRLERVEVQQKIWRWKVDEYGHQVLDIQPTDRVTSVSTPLNIAEFQHVLEAWRAALKQTRYPENEVPGYDATTYQFYSSHNLYGQTWSPDSGIPLMLVNLGKALEEFVRIEESGRPEVIEKANAIAERLLRQFSIRSN